MKICRAWSDKMHCIGLEHWADGTWSINFWWFRVEWGAKSKWKEGK
jgi:hypothetical protein